MTQNEEKLCSAIRLMLNRIDKLRERYPSEEWNFLLVLFDWHHPGILFTEISSGQSGSYGMAIDSEENLSEMADAVYNELVGFIENRKVEQCSAPSAVSP